ncbi:MULTISPECIES: hypothetical protein [unclassified Streptomyces]|uniref:hypothetical protein n=1 Tax=unclassified Streptomyces TaxID=2593676 RepID=UPI0003644425|nr:MULTISPECIES: hypothetical protein [unclassified Streptomyces]MYQ78673.1 hypothetical protein [Streptomyces sp. SID4923]
MGRIFADLRPEPLVIAAAAAAARRAGVKVAIPPTELGFVTVHAVDPARTVAAVADLLGTPPTGRAPDRNPI